MPRFGVAVTRPRLMASAVRCVPATLAPRSNQRNLHAAAAAAAVQRTQTRPGHAVYCAVGRMQAYRPRPRVARALQPRAHCARAHTPSWIRSHSNRKLCDMIYNTTQWPPWLSSAELNGLASGVHARACKSPWRLPSAKPQPCIPSIRLQLPCPTPQSAQNRAPSSCRGREVTGKKSLSECPKRRAHAPRSAPRRTKAGGRRLRALGCACFSCAWAG